MDARSCPGVGGRNAPAKDDNGRYASHETDQQPTCAMHNARLSAVARPGVEVSQPRAPAMDGVLRSSVFFPIRRKQNPGLAAKRALFLVLFRGHAHPRGTKAKQLAGRSPYTISRPGALAEPRLGGWGHAEVYRPPDTFTRRRRTGPGTPERTRDQERPGPTTTSGRPPGTAVAIMEGERRTNRWRPRFRRSSVGLR